MFQKHEFNIKEKFSINRTVFRIVKQKLTLGGIELTEKQN